MDRPTSKLALAALFFMKQQVAFLRLETNAAYDV